MIIARSHDCHMIDSIGHMIDSIGHMTVVPFFPSVLLRVTVSSVVVVSCDLMSGRSSSACINKS